MINLRRVCAARVTVLGLCVSWGAIFSVRGGKGGKKEEVKGQNEEGNLNAMKNEMVGKLWMNKNYSFHHSLS